MKEIVDIHTHRLPQVAGEVILNCYPHTFIPEKEGWYSIGIHPWYISASDNPDEHSAVNSTQRIFSSPMLKYSQCEAESLLLKELAQYPQVLAIGEAGLDKLADTPMSLQKEVFEFQARLAMQLDKPLIIHLVKAVDELLQLKQLIQPTNAWIIHGFRGKVALAEAYLRHGFYLSFGEKYQAEVVRIVPSERLFMETDESSISIAELYNRAAEIRGISCDELKETVSENVSKIFFKR